MSRRCGVHKCVFRYDGICRVERMNADKTIFEKCEYRIAYEESIPKKPNVCLSNGQVFSARFMRCMRPVLEEWISCPYCSGAIDWSEYD